MDDHLLSLRDRNRTRLIGSLWLTVDLHKGILRNTSTTMSNPPAHEAVIQQHRLHDKDTGSPQVQVAILTQRINHFSAHFETHKKDFNSRQGLLRMVGQRRRLLEYLKQHNEDAYRQLLDILKLRK